MKTLNVNGKIVKVSGYRKINGQTVPVIKAEAKEIKYPNGRVDVIVKVPFI